MSTYIPRALVGIIFEKLNKLCLLFDKGTNVGSSSRCPSGA